MNRYSRDISVAFLSKQNANYLHQSLSQYFRSATVDRFLRDNLDDQIGNFSVLISRELMTSDPLPGVTIDQQITGYNNQFIADEIDFIMKNVLNPRDESAPVTQYTVHDGLPTSRYGPGHHVKSPEDILKTWYYDSGRPVQSREDVAGDIGAESNQFYWGGQSGCMSTRDIFRVEYSGTAYPNGGSGNYPHNFSEHMTPNKIATIPYAPARSPLHTGITFANQSNLGTQNHVDMYEKNSNKVAMNNMREAYALTPFGVSTPAADARLLERRTFRYNNEIPRYEARLQKRNLDRDVSEGLRNAERGCMVHGYDMSSIHRRMENNKNVASQYRGAPSSMDLSSNYISTGDPGTTYY